MKLLLFLSLSLTALGAEPDMTKMAWPKAIRDFPPEEIVTFTSGAFRITRIVPDDPKIQAAGGSGGPVVEFTLRDTKRGWSATLLEQSIGERLLEPYRGKPQIEIWGRGGGGSFSRCLFRYLSGEYRCVRIDDFKETPSHPNRKAPTAKLPSARRGKGDQVHETLFLVETRVPMQE